MIVVLLGKTSSGKDTVCNQLIQKGYKKLVTYTTRPMRPGEVQDETYHFISKEEFETLISKGFSQNIHRMIPKKVHGFMVLQLMITKVIQTQLLF